MRALRYFPQEVLCNLESVLFGEISHSAKITYCLINDHQKVYYLGSTKNAAGLINRLRLSVMKEDYDEGDETEGMVYSNLDDTHLDLNPDDYQKLEYFRKKFEDFGFTLPEEGWKSIQSFQDATK
jgi:hypothetical protein